MYQTGKAAQIAEEMKNYKLSILGISETRWTKSGQKRLASGELILYSGHEEEGADHTEGVGLMLSSDAQQALIGWEALGPRFITATFKTKHKKIRMNVVMAYAPTNNSSEDVKTHFYDQLQAILESFKDRDINILMGDFNAKVGSDNTGYETCMGKHGTGEMNENGEMFADVCALFSYVIGGTIFAHKNIHKGTWVSPDHVTINQIDHICISKKFRRSLQDVKVRRGADVASDHHLVAAKLKLKLKKNWSSEPRRKARYNVNYLKDQTVREQYGITLNNRFDILQEMIDEDEGITVEQHWNAVKNTFNTTCEETLGRKKVEQEEWISAESNRKIQDRKLKKTAVNNSRTRAEKQHAQEEYSEAHREVRRSIRNDRRNYIEGLAQEAEEAAAARNMKDLYDTTKKLCGKFQQGSQPVKDKEGNSLKTMEQQSKRWVEHFEELLNRPEPANPPDIPEAEFDLPINCEKPSKEEIRRAIKMTKNGKAAGPDEIPAEAMKGDIETSVEILYQLFGRIWEEEEIPEEWKEGHLIKIPKKGDLTKCSNYRGITLLSVPGKIFNRIILERMKDEVDKELRDHQAGFRKERSCTDQIATLRIILEQSIEWNTSLYICFIDYEKAFDSLDRNTLWLLLRHYGVPAKLVNLIKNTYTGMNCKVVHEGKLSDSFEVKTGVRQGCLLSPFLFLLAIDWIMKTTTNEKRNGIQWTLWKQLDDLDFADDLALLSHQQQQMQEKVNVLTETSERTGLNIHRGKTKLLKINHTSQEPIKIKAESLEEVESFTYLGSVVDKEGGTEADVKARIGKARAAFIQLRNIWKSSKIRRKTKLRIFNSNVKSVLLYGAETWRTTKNTVHKIQTFVNRCLRQILKIHWPDKISNERLWEITNQLPMEEELLRRRWGWLGHTLRKPATNITYQALSWNPQGKRKRGRPKNTWRRDLAKDINNTGMGWRQLVATAQNRGRWRMVVVGLASRRIDGP